MVHHIGNNFQKAFAVWEKAEQVARTLCKKPAYAAMITLYSRSQITYRVGLEKAGELNRKARELWEVVGRRQFYFTGLGSDLAGCIRVV